MFCYRILIVNLPTKFIQKRKAIRTGGNVITQMLMLESPFPDICLVVTFFVLNVEIPGEFFLGKFEKGQPVANMRCEDLVLLRSHQDFAYMTHYLVAGRLGLR